MKKCSLYLVILISQFFFAFAAHAEDIQFKNDLVVNLCTGFPNGTWGHCCYEHDISYWAGGTFQERKNADIRLKQCVDVSGGPGDLMYEGVRRFGYEFWSDAWGHVSFSELSAEEKKMVLAEVQLWKNLGYPHNFEFINYETALFPVVTQQHRVLIKRRMQQFIRTPGYVEFFNTYVKVTGQYPTTIQYH